MLSLVVASTLAWPQAPDPPLTVTPARLTFITRAGSSTSSPQRVKVASAGRADVSWRAVPSAPWLRVSPAAGTSPGELTIAVDADGLREGTHRGQVTISANELPGPHSVVEVSVEIALPASPAPAQAVAAPPSGAPPPASVPADVPAPSSPSAVPPPSKGTGGRLSMAAQMPAATRNLPYSQAIPITGGKPPFAIRLTQGRLPPGFRLADGAITGVTRQAGNYAFVIAATDSATPPATVAQMMSLRVILLYPDTALAVNPAAISLVSNAAIPNGLGQRCRYRAAGRRWTGGRRPMCRGSR